MADPADLVLLFDVDNTLLDNDGFQAELSERLERALGAEARDRYWALFEQLRGELGYADYLGAIERLRREAPREMRILSLSNWLIDYPFADLVYPGAFEAARHARRWGTPAILSDGDAVFQPHKIERAGLRRAFDDRALIYVHKEHELDDVARRLPARRYALIDDKLRILAAVKQAWGDRVTTIFVKQGHYALDAHALADLPPADVEIGRIADLPQCEPLLARAARKPL